MSNVARAKALSRLLRQLAHRGRILVSTPAGGGNAPVDWWIADWTGEMVEASAGNVVADCRAVEDARRRGLIELDAQRSVAGPSVWQLSRRGRALLRGGEMISEAMGYAPDRERRVPEAAGSADSPVGWLRRHKGKDGLPLVGDAECLASERLNADYLSAMRLPNTTLNWSLAGSVDHASRSPDGGVADRMDRLIMAQRRLQAALDDIGPELAPVLIAACCHAQGLRQIEEAHGWPQRSAKVVLAIALQQLARHYGLASNDPRNRRGDDRGWNPDGSCLSTEGSPRAHAMGLPSGLD